MHSLVWLQNSKGEPAPTFWSQEDAEDTSGTADTSDVDHTEILAKRKEKIEDFADKLTSTDPMTICCDEHKGGFANEDCAECMRASAKGQSMLIFTRLLHKIKE